MVDKFDFFEEETESEGFKIDSDALADWAIMKIKAERDEAERLVSIGNEQIETIKEKQDSIKKQAENKCRYLLSLLNEYFHCVPHKETKTQETYKLLSGSLVKKKASIKYEKDEKAFSEWLEANGYDSLVETVKKPKWAEFKSQIAVDGDGNVIDTETGCFVEGITTVVVPESFDIK